MAAEYFVPDWPVPSGVAALQSLRGGGGSQAPYDSLNLGDHVGDALSDVAANRRYLTAILPGEPQWLTQVHGVTVAELSGSRSGQPVEADAALSRTPGVVCAVLTADCLPVLLCDRAGSVVAAVHAGWRGLCNGVIEASLARMAVPGREILAWLGPAIGPESFEVGDEVRAAFMAKDSAAASAFQAKGDVKWLADLYLLARQRLEAEGVTAIYGGGECTFSDRARYFSFRRDGVTGRQASAIWLR